ncbi:hypothetical protein M378DRAFT_308828 [Amanita muscaria Koide BX008]|uniref:Uncharacterized protein n=1 Tax=Amanita muscaria (strain Koide BX008) TaxID=946122 RepID=A0A0C2WBK1_AMAMK|nr:hypothetical protein M378DRAFT_308828 [Amanita muscaria Koide BX008]
MLRYQSCSGECQYVISRAQLGIQLVGLASLAHRDRCFHCANIIGTLLISSRCLNSNQDIGDDVIAAIACSEVQLEVLQMPRTLETTTPMFCVP